MKIAIASGKGGTGKTTISTNLAACLSESIPSVSGIHDLKRVYELE